MPRFNGLQLILEDGFSKTEADAVTMGSRSMLNFVERRLTAGRHESEFTKLNIYCSKAPVVNDLIRYKEPKTFAGINVQMDIGEFLSPPARFQETCAEIVRRGIRAASQHTTIPQRDILRAIDDFIDGGFLNQWVHTDKTWTRANVRSVILCDLRTDAFVLTQRVHKDNKLLADATIATTKPREWLFYPLLGKLTLSKSQIIFRATNKVLSTYNLEIGELILPK